MSPDVVDQYDRRLHAISMISSMTGMTSIFSAIDRFRSCHIRSVYYHGVAPEHEGTFREQIAFFAHNYNIIKVKSSNDLADFMAGSKQVERGLVITFDDGLRSQARAAEILAERNIEGVFCVPAGILSLATIPEQLQFCQNNNIRAPDQGTTDRVFLSIEELRAMGVRHAIGSHTIGHMRLSEATSEAVIRQQLASSRERLTEALGFDIEHFAWVGGEELNYPREAARILEECGYRYGYTTLSCPLRPAGNQLMINRTNIESRWPLQVVRFQLSGIPDIKLSGKRKRVEQRYFRQQ